MQGKLYGWSPMRSLQAAWAVFPLWKLRSLTISELMTVQGV